VDEKYWGKKKICNDLWFVIEREIDLGSSILSAPSVLDWPMKGVIPVALKNDLNLSAYDLPVTARHVICTDPHFG
jgi:hypothetical protein